MFIGFQEPSLFMGNKADAGLTESLKKNSSAFSKKKKKRGMAHFSDARTIWSLNYFQIASSEWTSFALAQPCTEVSFWVLGRLFYSEDKDQLKLPRFWLCIYTSWCFPYKCREGLASFEVRSEFVKENLCSVILLVQNVSSIKWSTS